VIQTTPGLVSVIIVNFNGEAYLASCLGGLVRQSHPLLEVIIVDNLSRDRSLREIEIFRTQHPELTVQVLANTKNVGFCQGNNQGIAGSSGEFVLVLNADVTLDPDWIAILVRLMNSSPGVGAAIGKLLSGHDSKHIDSTGIAIYKTRRAVDRGQAEEDRGQYEHQEDVFGGSGAACLYRRSMLEEIKYPPHEYSDALFFAYKEDVDLAWRARLHGWRCIYNPEARARHFRNWGSGKRRQVPRWVRCHSLKNRYLMLLKNERFDTLLPGVFHLLGYEAASVGYILFREPYLLKAFWMILRCLPEVFRKRTLTQAGVQDNISRENLLPWFH
jgi:GT2 family glycosyltransferase